MKNKILYAEMAKQFDLTDKKGNLPNVGDIAIHGELNVTHSLNDYEIRFGVYKKESHDYYDTNFDGCGFHLVSLKDERDIIGLGKNSKNYTFVSKKEYAKIVENRKQEAIRKLEAEKMVIERKLNQARS